MRSLISVAVVIALLAGSAMADTDFNLDGVTSVAAGDILGPGQARADYDAATGQILISSNGSAQIDIISTAGLLIPANAVPLGSVPGAVFQDPPSTTEIDYQAFTALGPGGILNSFSIGAILPPGLPFVGGYLPLSTATFHWAIPGGGEFFYPIGLPEPSSFVLAGFAGIGLFVAARRRKVGKVG